MAAELLLRLAKLTGNDAYRGPQRSSAHFPDHGIGDGAAADRLWAIADCRLDDLLSPSQEIAVVGERADLRTQLLLQEVWRQTLPAAQCAGVEGAGVGQESPLPLFEADRS